MRSTAICRLFGFASLALMVGAWLWAAQGPAPAGLAWIDRGMGLGGRMVAKPAPKSSPPVAEADTKPLPQSPSDARREQFRRQLEFTQRRQQMLERIWKESSRHEPSSNERSHASIKRAFRETVAATRPATVRVFSEGKQVALGAVVRADGLIATKGSEARGKVECELADGRRLTARQVAADEANDLVLLRVSATQLPTVTLAPGEMPGVGCWLATCGTGVDPVAVGVVSVAAREIRPPRGILGVLLGEGEGGARIDEVMPGSAAAEAGLLPGDRILELNNQAVKGRQQMVNMLKQKQAGDKVRLKLARDKEQLELRITLGSEEMSGMRADRFQMMNMLGGPLSARRAGFSSAIQHDTVLSPRDCGGPVVDLDGRVVALNIARAGRVDSYAIPASVVERLVKSQPAPTPVTTKPQPVTHKEPVQQ